MLALERTRDTPSIHLSIIEDIPWKHNRAELLANLIKKHVHRCISLVLRTRNREFAYSVFPLRGRFLSLHNINIALDVSLLDSPPIEFFGEGAECRLRTLSLSSRRDTIMSLDSLDTTDITELDFDEVLVPVGTEVTLTSFVGNCPNLNRLRWIINQFRLSDTTSSLPALPHLRILETNSLHPSHGNLFENASQLRHLLLAKSPLPHRDVYDALIGLDYTSLHRMFPLVSTLTLTGRIPWVEERNIVPFIQQHPALIALELPTESAGLFLMEMMGDSETNPRGASLYGSLLLIHIRDQTCGATYAVPIPRRESVGDIADALPDLLRAIPNLFIEFATELSWSEKKRFGIVLKKWPTRLIFIDPSEPYVPLSERFPA